MPGWSRLLVVLLILPLLMGFNPLRDKRTPEQERQDVQKMRTEVLDKLYSLAPASKERIERAAGYAVFSNVGVNLLLISSGNGYGIAHDKATGKDTYMKMLSAGVGIGYGVKDFRAVFIFATAEAMNRFITEGWQATAQSDAAAKHGEEGDAMNYEIELTPDIKLYQITESGLALQATLQGTKYFVDKDLN